MSRVLGAFDLTGLQALGAYVSLTHMTVLANGHLLNVGLKSAIGHTVAVADAAPSAGCLAANFTYLRHFPSLFRIHTRPHSGASFSKQPTYYITPCAFVQRIPYFLRVPAH